MRMSFVNYITDRCSEIYNYYMRIKYFCEDISYFIDTYITEPCTKIRFYEYFFITKMYKIMFVQILCNFSYVIRTQKNLIYDLMVALHIYTPASLNYFNLHSNGLKRSLSLYIKYFMEPTDIQERIDAINDEDQILWEHHDEYIDNFTHTLDSSILKNILPLFNVPEKDDYENDNFVAADMEEAENFLKNNK